MDYVYGQLGTKNLFEKIKKTKNIYIETGTYNGTGVAYALNHFDEVHSIEISERFYDPCVVKYKDNPKVKLHLGDSRVKLLEILKDTNKPCVIFLDAHGDINVQGPNPLYEELKSIKENSINNHIILIDDVRRMGDETDPCWSKIDKKKLHEMLKDINNEYHIFEYKDTLIAALKEDLNLSWWENNE